MNANLMRDIGMRNTEYCLQHVGLDHGVLEHDFPRMMECTWLSAPGKVSGSALRSGCLSNLIGRYFVTDGGPQWTRQGVNVVRDRQVQVIQGRQVREDRKGESLFPSLFLPLVPRLYFPATTTYFRSFNACSRYLFPSFVFVSSSQSVSRPTHP